MADNNESVWDAVNVLRKNTRQVNKTNPSLSSQIRNGNTETLKKQSGRGGESTKAYKLDQATDPGRHKTVSTNLKSIIIKARSSAGITRGQLAQKCCVKESIISSYENGTAIPDNAILGKMERNLGVKLRGKNIGDPLNKNKK